MKDAYSAPLDVCQSSPLLATNDMKNLGHAVTKGVEEVGVSDLVSLAKASVPDTNAQSATSLSMQTEGLQVVHARDGGGIAVSIPVLALRFPQEDLGVDRALASVAYRVLARHCKELGHARDTSGLLRLTYVFDVHAEGNLH